MADNKNAEQKKREAQSGMAAYEAERTALLARTEKLRAMRLAREAEDAANAPPPEVKATKVSKAKGTKVVKSATTTKTKAAKGKKAPSESLSNWMTSQKDSGRNN